MMKINFHNSILTLGIILVLVAMFIFSRILFPAIREEIKYSLFLKPQSLAVVSQKEAEEKNKEKPDSQMIVPVDEEFGIVIPKIGANAKVISEVDPQNPDIYQEALSKGVAHAKGSALPSEDGNVFIFAHSGADPVEANRYNAVFYLLSKLEKDDEIYVFYQDRKYIYNVSDIKTVSASEVSYLTDKSLEKKLTLMTCWPPGTTMKRLLIVAKPLD